MESDTATESDLQPGYGHPPYGAAALRDNWFDSAIWFAGAETAAVHGGLVEGAILAGELAAAQVLTSVQK